MKKFVVAHLSMYDNELKQELVEAEDDFHAAISYLGYEKQDTEAKNLGELQDELWDSEEHISVFEIKPEKKTTSGISGASQEPYPFPKHPPVH